MDDIDFEDGLFEEDLGDLPSGLRVGDPVSFPSYFATFCLRYCITFKTSSLRSSLWDKPMLTCAIFLLGR